MSPDALIFQASPVFTAVAVLVHFMVPIPRSTASTARSWVQLLPSEQFGSPCGVTVTDCATSAVSTLSSRGPNVVGASVSAAASSGLPSGAHALTQAAANALTAAAEACFSLFGSGFPSLPDLLSEQPAVTRTALRQTIAAVRFTLSTLARQRVHTEKK